MVTYRIVSNGTVLATFQVADVNPASIASHVMTALILPEGTSLSVRADDSATYHAQYGYTILLVEPVPG